MIDTFAFSHDGHYLAIGGMSRDSGIRVLDWTTKKDLFPASRPHGAVAHLAYSPNSRQIAAATADGQISLYDTNGQVAHGIETPRNVQIGQIAFAMGGRLLLLPSQGRHDAVVTSPAKVAFFELVTGARLGELATPVDSFTSLTLSDDDRQLALGQANGTILICDGKQWLDKLFSRFPAGESRRWKSYGIIWAMLIQASRTRPSGECVCKQRPR